MICRRCKTEYNEQRGSCPNCGAAAGPLSSGVLKTSTILISSGNVEGVYRSVKEVPARLRRQLVRSTNSLNSATILIADRRGRETIANAVRRLPPGARHRLLGSLLGGISESPRGLKLEPRWRRVIAFLAAALVLLLTWMIFAYRPV